MIKIKPDQKVKAYTILELTVAMLIASISITIAYTAFDILSRSYRGFDSRNKIIAELVLADRLLRQDFSGGKLLVRTSEGLHVKTDSGLITYSFTPGYILRNQYGLRTDTIRAASGDINFTYEQGQSEPGGLVDRLQLTVISDNEAMQRVYEKVYSSEELFNPETITEDEYTDENYN